MAEPVINLITSPDKVHTQELSFLLINPSDDIKSQFNEVIKDVKRTVNLYLFEEGPDNDVEWMLDVLHIVDYVILDIDNTKDEWLIGYILSFDKTYYLTNHPQRPYNVISSNRIFEVRQLAEGVNYYATAPERKETSGS